jgi:hypothetical protein
MSNLPDYDEITRLRLQLYQAELQRDAFKALADKAVTDLIRQVMDKEKPRIYSIDIPNPDTFRYGMPADHTKSEAHPIDGWLNMGNDKLLKRIETLEAEFSTNREVRIMQGDNIAKLISENQMNRDNIDHLIRRVEALEAKSNG